MFAASVLFCALYYFMFPEQGTNSVNGYNPLCLKGVYNVTVNVTTLPQKDFLKSRLEFFFFLRKLGLPGTRHNAGFQSRQWAWVQILVLLSSALGTVFNLSALISLSAKQAW